MDSLGHNSSWRHYWRSARRGLWPQRSNCDRCHWRTLFLSVGIPFPCPVSQACSRGNGIDQFSSQNQDKSSDAPSPVIIALILLFRVEKVASETFIHQLSSNFARKASPRARRRRVSRVAMFLFATLVVSRFKTRF